MSKQLRKTCSTSKVSPYRLWEMYVEKVGDSYSYEMIEKLGQKAVKDLEKVKFDFENFYNSHLDEELGIDTSFLGYRSAYVSNGFMPFISCKAGGDWEYPIYFIIYLEPNCKTFRCYIPKDGNPWNYYTYQAFGNNDKADNEFAQKYWKNTAEFNLDDADALLDFGKMIFDIGQRFVVVD